MESKEQTLIEQINSFDGYFEFSDSEDVYERGLSKEKEIKHQLQKLTTTELAHLLQGLNSNGKLCFERYFNNLN